MGNIRHLILGILGESRMVHPEKLKEKLMKHAQENPDWLFFKGCSLKFSERHGISMIRLITLAGALMILTSGVLIALQLLEIIK